MATALHPMVGGYKFQQTVLDWTKQSNHLFLSVFGSLLLVWAIFTEKLPVEFRWQLSTTLGRLLLLLLLYIVHLLAGWIPAVIFTIAVALTWANRPLYKPPTVTENFQDVKETDVSCAPKWFIEKALKENPVRIKEDRIQTFASQDDRSESGRVSR